MNSLIILNTIVCFNNNNNQAFYFQASWGQARDETT
jgi:hypothetical protein